VRVALELEKVLSPFIIPAKKRYCGLQYEDITKSPKLIFKGIQVSRRDSCKLLKRTLTEAINKVMYEKDVQGAVRYVQQVSNDLLSGKVPMEDLIMSKTLRTGYANNNQPHLQVANKMRERAPGSEPRSGDRVPFVYVQTADPTKKSLACMQAEDPTYVRDNNLKIDVMYYWKNCLQKPLSDLFDLMLANSKEQLFNTKELKVIQNEVVANHKKQRTIRSFFLTDAPMDRAGPSKNYML
jgi:DNA polymerase delta subunit 1